MNQKLIKGQVPQNIFIKYKKWIIAAIGVQVIPTLLFIITLIGFMVYSYTSSEIRGHPYMQYIYGGYNIGVEDGAKDKGLANDHESGEYSKSRESLMHTPWVIYRVETTKLKKQTLKEKEGYIESFPVAERGAKLADMNINNIKLPLQQKLDQRYKQAINFFIDLVTERVDRGNFLSDEAYNKALEQVAWKLGYEYGYGKGRVFGYGHTTKNMR